MISYIKGQVEEIKDGLVVIDNGGIGYEAIVSSFTVTQARKNPYMQLYTYMSVSEAGLFLYGFYSKEEKDMFLKLITISGVGPKAAISILSGIDVNTLLVTIFNQDVKTLSKVKGIGKKTAERIILELKGNINDMNFDNILTMDMTMASDEIADDKDSQDAISALEGLGFKTTEAISAVKKVRDKANSLEELIKLALRSLR